jgi:predicted transcriptional regulator
LPEENNLVAMAIEVVASYVSHNNMRPDDLPGFIAQTHAAIAALNAVPEPEPAGGEPETVPEHQPAVTVRKSLASRDHILSMIDGKPYKTLKRHIARHGMTPAEYRERYGLKADYPMTAPAYSEHRREVAKTLGLGRKPGTSKDAASLEASAVEPEPVAEPAKAKRGAKAEPPSDATPQPAKRRGRPPKSAPPAEASANELVPDLA